MNRYKKVFLEEMLNSQVSKWWLYFGKADI